MMVEKRTYPWRADLILFFLFLIFYASLGGYLSLVKHYMPYDALARLVSAWLVWGGAETKLATIGFVWPPIPTLALLPFTWFQPLVQSWLALVLVSTFFMAIAVVLVNRILDLCGVGGAWRWSITVLFGLNPLIVVFGINGMSEAILVAACLAAFYALLRFWNTNRNMHMMLAAFFFSLLPLIRYEFAILSAAAGGLLIIHSWRQRAGLGVAAFRDYLEGRLLAFSSLAIYPIFLWSLASWMIMGSPFYYLVNDRSATSLASAGLSSLGINTGLLDALWIVFRAWYLSFPVGLAALAILLFLSWRKRSWKYLGFALVTQLVPLEQLILVLQRANVPLLRYYMTSVLFGLLLVGLVIDALRREYRLGAAAMRGVSAAALLLVLLSNFATAGMLDAYPYRDMEQNTWTGLTTSAQVQDVDFADAFKFGQVLPQVVAPGSRVLVDTYQFGFGVMLGANSTRMFMDFTDPNYDKAVLDPPAYVDYVLVPKTEGRGALYSVNREFPKLHDEGALWAEAVAGLPATQGDWRLFKVIR